LADRNLVLVAVPGLGVLALEVDVFGAALAEGAKLCASSGAAAAAQAPPCDSCKTRLFGNPTQRWPVISSPPGAQIGSTTAWLYSRLGTARSSRNSADVAGFPRGHLGRWTLGRPPLARLAHQMSLCAPGVARARSLPFRRCRILPHEMDPSPATLRQPRRVP
jgi:hypothetical protein